MPLTLRTRKLRMKKIIAALQEAYPEALCELDFRNAFEVLVATILSAQCTDKNVNTVTPSLFKKYPTPAKMARAHVTDVETVIKRLGLYKNKAKNIVAASIAMVERHDGQVPDTLEELVALAGVGRKTANCVLVNAFGKPGIMVDTHCKRLSNRIGLSDESNPDKIERDLAALMPPEEWGHFSHRIILHGRRVCHARKPDCPSCCIRKFCEDGRRGTFAS